MQIYFFFFFFWSNKFSISQPHLPVLQKVTDKHIVSSIPSKRMWKETRQHRKGLPTLKLCTTLMAQLQITLMQSNDNWPHRRVATTSSTSLTSNTPLPGVMNQSDLLELDDITLQKVIGSKSKVQGAIPFWIGFLVVHGKAWDYSEAGTTIRNSPGKPRQVQNTGRKPTTATKRSQFYSPSSSETSGSPLERPIPQTRRKNKTQSIIYFFRIGVPEPH